MAAKKTKGRQKVEMKRIDNQDDRLITFSKRRSGIYKKASELVTLTGAEITAIVFSPSGKPFSFGHPSVESVLNRFLEDPSSVDCTCRLVEAHRRMMRVEGLAKECGEMQHQLDEKKETSHRLKGKIKENDSKGWWDAPIEELDLIKDLMELDKKFEMLQTTMHNHLVKNNNGASSSQAPEISGYAFASTANDPNASVFADGDLQSGGRYE